MGRKANGMRSCDDGSRTRMAITATTGMSDATAPFTLISAVSKAHTTITNATTLLRLVPARAKSRGDVVPECRCGGHGWFLFSRGQPACSPTR